MADPAIVCSGDGVPGLLRQARNAHGAARQRLREVLRALEAFQDALKRRDEALDAFRAFCGSMGLPIEQLESVLDDAGLLSESILDAISAGPKRMATAARLDVLSPQDEHRAEQQNIRDVHAAVKHAELAQFLNPHSDPEK